jgi:glucosamine-6-phosphate deaminase
MKLSICPSAAVAAAFAAGRVADQLTARPDSVLGLPTGRTSLGIYRELVRLHAAGGADFSRAHTFNLDEFIGLTSQDRRSYCAFMATHLFRRVNIPAGHVHFLNGQAADLDDECLRYERLIDELANDLQGWEGANVISGSASPRALGPVHRRCSSAGRDGPASPFGGRMLRCPAMRCRWGWPRSWKPARSCSLPRANESEAASLFTGSMRRHAPCRFYSCAKCT